MCVLLPLTWGSDVAPVTDPVPREPTLLVQGDADAFVPPADTARLLQRLPHARASVWSGAGHAMHWVEPARLAAELMRFVRALTD